MEISHIDVNARAKKFVADEYGRDNGWQVTMSQKELIEQFEFVFKLAFRYGQTQEVLNKQNGVMDINSAEIISINDLIALNPKDEQSKFRFSYWSQPITELVKRKIQNKQ